MYDLPSIRTEEEQIEIDDIVIYRYNARDLGLIFGMVLEVSQDKKGKQIYKVDWLELDQLTQLLNNDSRASWIYGHQIEKVNNA